jgi:hypothetical protein
LEERAMGDGGAAKGVSRGLVAGDEDVCYALGVSRPDGKCVWRADDARVLQAAAVRRCDWRRGLAPRGGRAARTDGGSYVKMRLLVMEWEEKCTAAGCVMEQSGEGQAWEEAWAEERITETKHA